MIVFYWMRTCDIFLPIIILLYTWVEVDLERPPVEQIWPELMDIILAVNARMVPFIQTFWVEKGNGLSPSAVSIDSPHVLSELVKEYFKIPTLDRRGFSTGTVDEDEKEVEDVDDDGPSVGNGE